MSGAKFAWLVVSIFLAISGIVFGFLFNPMFGSCLLCFITANIIVSLTKEE